MTQAQLAREQAVNLAASASPALLAELNAIAQRVADAKSPAELEMLERQFGERARHLKERLGAPPPPPS